VTILVLTILAIAGLLICLLYGLHVNYKLSKEYIADTAELYVEKITQDMFQIDSELVSIMQNDENIRSVPDTLTSEQSDHFQILWKIVTQNKLLRIRYHEVQNFFVYINNADALITENGTVFSQSVKTDFTEKLMEFLQTETTKDSITTQWKLLTLNEEHYIVGWYATNEKVIGCVMDLDTIFLQLQEEIEEYQIIPYLQTLDGTYILPDDTEPDIQTKIEREYDSDNRFSSPLGRVGTMYFYVYQNNGILHAVRNMQIFFTVLVFVLLFLAVLEIYVYSQRILDPLRRFVDGLEDMSEEQFLHDDAHNNLIELESANSKFKELIRKIQSLKIAIYEKELTEKTAELEYAQEQIRPHFYLNCLSLIHGIADRKSEKEILHITEVLSDYIRYIFRDYKKQMALDSELEHVEAYVEIQKLRYGENAFSYETMLDGDVGGCLVPSLLLQTLVENSIVHAVNLDRPIEVSLYITREQYEGVDSIYICVSDTGDGFSKEVLEAIENDTPIYYNGRKHVGLQNICRRLKLMYGERASVSFSNMAENYGAVVEVRVPAMKEN
jgi:sensor histidine kinase YesM